MGRHARVHGSLMKESSVPGGEAHSSTGLGSKRQRRPAREESDKAPLGSLGSPEGSVKRVSSLRQ